MPALAVRAAPEPDRLSTRNFERLSRFIFAQAGIKMPGGKTMMLEGRLRRRLRQTGCETLDDYCDYFFADGHATEEATFLINAVTTNKTDFFREPRHFDYLIQTVLPALKASGKRRVRAWSAACSTGAEPYTLAMVLDDYASGQGGPDFGILATDIDTDVLEVARRGVYPADQVEPVSPVLRARYVLRSRDRHCADVRIAPALRSAIGFAQLNLMDRDYPVGDPMDIIFCRNVLIYFDKPSQERVVRQLCDRLRPGGHLFLGHSESIAGLDLPLRQVRSTVFERN